QSLSGYQPTVLCRLVLYRIGRSIAPPSFPGTVAPARTLFFRLRRPSFRPKIQSALRLRIARFARTAFPALPPPFTFGLAHLETNQLFGNQVGDRPRHEAPTAVQHFESLLRRHKKIGRWRHVPAPSSIYTGEQSVLLKKTSLKRNLA